MTTQETVLRILLTARETTITQLYDAIAEWEDSNQPAATMVASFRRRGLIPPSD